MKKYTVFTASAALMLIITLAFKKENLYSNNKLELIFEDSTYQITGISKDGKGRLLINYPRWSSTYKYAIVQAQGMHGKIPYPNEAMNRGNQDSPGKTSGYVFNHLILMMPEPFGYWILLRPC